MAYLGLFLIGLGFLLMAWPIVLSGAFSVGPGLFIALVMVPVGIGVVFYAALSPDPERSTIGGWFGNPEENWLRRRERARPLHDPSRYRPSPRESVNCRGCYTAIPAQQADCPRCGRRRACRNCGKPLFYLGGAVRCGPCVKDEVYCDCPNLKSPVARAR